MKQLVPTDIDEYIAEHKAGDEVTGRIVDASGAQVLVELGEGIRALCASAAKAAPAAKAASAPKAAKVDLSSLSSMLKARWKGDAPDPKAAPEALAEGQIRTFKITKIDAEAKRIEVELA
jgi:small subunit ribosomal protein S1